ncbi:MAG: AAA family ATPase [Deltaproteobacteria bacterium]|nr:AAA family ATPase [Deltaproteobacteria bacterium]MBW1717984.1 AAA family ATPase [Deltaproteobacteria bacterium]MBW2080412.1 AAA family ATPase [Deltaproteobacteria bacterium]MBW2349641.1 AAA family ATPase [Deltaproteobacteria bacterium]
MAGKGGTGKTTISALLIRYLVGKGLTPVLAVDADANENLNELVGLSVETSLGDIRERMKTETPPGMAKRDYMEMYINRAIIEAKGFDLLAMGQPEGPGCYCMANTILAQVIEGLARSYRYLIVDNEAGMEHLSRLNLRKIHTLFVVSDPSIRGLVTAARIADLTKALKLEVRNKVLVVNRVPKDLPKVLEDQIQEVVQKTDLLFGGCIPVSDDIFQSELHQESLLKLSTKTDAVQVITRIFDKFL